MKIIAFKMTKITGNHDLVATTQYFATITIRKWFCADTQRELTRAYADEWHYMDDGQYVPMSKINPWQRVWEAQQALNKD